MKKKMDVELKEKDKKNSALDAFLDTVVKETDIERMEDMHRNKIVPICISSYNRASTIGGISTGCVHSLCGESAGGKSTFGVTVCNAFSSLGYPTLYIDAETTADPEWFQKLGVPLNRTLRIVPRSLEHGYEEVDKFIDLYKIAKEENPDWAACIVLDSYNKIRPAKEMKSAVEDEEEEDKKGKKQKQQGIGKSFPLHAMMMTNWLNHLTPILYHLDISFLVVRHDKANMNRNSPWEPETKVSGAYSMKYENSAMTRFNISTKDKEEIDGKDVVVGYWHTFQVEKNKDGIRDETGKFYISNGKGDIPKGFDPYYTDIEEGIYQGVIVKEEKRLVVPGINDGRFTMSKLREALVADNKFHMALQEQITSIKHWERQNIKRGIK